MEINLIIRLSFSPFIPILIRLYVFYCLSSFFMRNLPCEIMNFLFPMIYLVQVFRVVGIITAISIAVA
jgi:hypothetical protein